MLNIFFNGINSRDLNLTLEKYSDFPVTNKLYKFTDIPGRVSNVKLFDKYVIDDFIFDFIFICGDKEFTQRKHKILDWINNIDSNELIFSQDISVYFKVQTVNISSFKTESRKVRRFTLTFKLVPFMYLKEGKNIIELNKSNTIFNVRATKESQPIINIYGKGSTTININNRSFYISEIGGHITIDSENEKVLENKGQYMQGEFPYLDIGENFINWDGNISKIEILPNWRCY